MFDPVQKSQPRLVLPDEGTPADEAVWVAQLLAGGADPTPQLKRARTLLLSLGGLSGLLKASPEQLSSGGPLNGQEVALLSTLQRVVDSAQSACRPVIDSFRALERFLRMEPVGAGVVVTRALLIGDRHCLRADIVLARGGGPLSFDQRQELIRLCIEHCASAAILARTADPIDPPMPDRAREANVVACSLELLGMRLLDYVLVRPSEVVRVRWCKPCAATALMS